MFMLRVDLDDKSKGKSKTGKREDEETLLIEKGGCNSAGKIDFSFQNDVEKKDLEKKDKNTNTLENDYDILQKPKMQTEVLIKGSNIKLSNHIVVCGLHSSIYHFILPLRAK